MKTVFQNYEIQLVHDSLHMNTVTENVRVMTSLFYFTYYSTTF